MNYIHHSPSLLFGALLFHHISHWQFSIILTTNSVKSFPSDEETEIDKGLMSSPSDTEKIKKSIFGDLAYYDFHYIVSILRIPEEIKCKSYDKLISFTHIYIGKMRLWILWMLRPCFICLLLPISCNTGDKAHTQNVFERKIERKQ